MVAVALKGGAYTARAVIANAQRCVNLYPEPNPKDAESEFSYYLTPGLTLLSAGPTNAQSRCYYWANNQKLYAVVGNGVYVVDAGWNFTLLGNIGTFTGICYMADNQTTIVLVDSSTSGYTINMANNAFAAIVDANFLGATRIDYIDTFLIFNDPGTSNWYCTTAGVVTPFNPQYVGEKVGFADLLSTLIVLKKQVWLLGQRTTELWFDAGLNPFPFAAVQGTFIEHGIIAPYSVAKTDDEILWLSQDQQGQGIVLMGLGYDAKRVSTYAIEAEFVKYPTLTDAIGFTYQQAGHTFYVLIFPSADTTWVYDLGAQLWHQRTWIDNNGTEHRIRANCCANAYGKIVVGDWQTGALYQLDPNNYTDNDQPIVRRRGFPHLVNDGRRVTYLAFRADMQCGEDTGAVDGTTEADPPLVYLRWSDDRGRTWGVPVPQTMGAEGEFLTQPQWTCLGQARDRVFELFWSVPAFTALQGAWVDPEPAGS